MVVYGHSGGCGAYLCAVLLRARYAGAALAPLVDKISLAFVYGSVARGEEHAVSDIDLMVVAEALDYPTLYEALQTAEAALGRTIHPNLMSVAEWQRKRGEADSFAARIASQPRLMLIGGDDVD